MRSITVLLAGVALIVSLCLLVTPSDGQVEATVAGDSVVTSDSISAPDSISTAPDSISTVPDSISTVPDSISTAPDSISTAPESISATPGLLFAIIETDRGLIRLELHASRAPMTVANFVNLVERGFYDGLTFHRLHPGQFVQGGSPDGRSDGGPGYVVDNEFVADLTHSAPGVLSMAGGPGGNGSQFFITLDARPFMDGMHTVFGRVVDSQAVVDAIRPGDVMRRVTIEGEPTALLRRYRDSVAEWNALLDGVEGVDGVEKSGGE